MKDLVAPYYNSSLVPGKETNSVPVPAECKGPNQIRRWIARPTCT